MVYNDTEWGIPKGRRNVNELDIEVANREFQEETGLEVQVGAFIAVTEHVRPPLHAVELFYKVKRIGGQLGLGQDPELPSDNQINTSLQFVTFNEIKVMPVESKHQILQIILDSDGDLT